MSRAEWPRVIVVADGSCGDSCSVLGISTDYIVESCHAYGANATIERLDQRQVSYTQSSETHSHASPLNVFSQSSIFMLKLQWTCIILAFFLNHCCYPQKSLIVFLNMNVGLTVCVHEVIRVLLG